MASSFTGTSHMQLHFLKKLFDDAAKQFNFLNNHEQGFKKEPLKTKENGDETSSIAVLDKSKRLKDIRLFQTLMSSLGHEIMKHGTAHGFNNYVTQELQEITDNHQLINDFFANKRSVESLEIELQEVTTKKDNLVEELEKKVYESELERDDSKLIEECRIRTVKRWEDSRCDQNAIMFHLEEQHLFQELLELDEAIDDDRMINFHTERYLDTCINDLFDTIGEWDDRITRETDDLENKMQQLSERRFNFEKKKKQCEEIYLRQKETIDEFKAKMEKEKELILMEKCSIKIQAWWKGVMVRKKLGPFKPKTKKKKKGKQRRK